MIEYLKDNKKDNTVWLAEGTLHKLPSPTVFEFGLLYYIWSGNIIKPHTCIHNGRKIQTSLDSVLYCLN